MPTRAARSLAPRGNPLHSPTGRAPPPRTPPTRRQRSNAHRPDHAIAGSTPDDRCSADWTRSPPPEHVDGHYPTRVLDHGRIPHRRPLALHVRRPADQGIDRRSDAGRTVTGRRVTSPSQKSRSARRRPVRPSLRRSATPRSVTTTSTSWLAVVTGRGSCSTSVGAPFTDDGCAITDSPLLRAPAAAKSWCRPIIPAAARPMPSTLT